MPLARETYLDALTAALFTGRLAGGGGTQQVAAAALAARAGTRPTPADLLLDGLAMLIAHGPRPERPGSGSPSRRSRAASRTGRSAALAVAGRSGGGIHLGLRGLGPRSPTRTSGPPARRALAELVLALTTRVGVHLLAGRPAAAALVEEADALARATGGGVAPRYGALALAAYRGREDELPRLARVATEDFVARGEGLGVTATTG